MFWQIMAICAAICAIVYIAVCLLAAWIVVILFQEERATGIIFWEFLSLPFRLLAKMFF